MNVEAEISYGESTEDYVDDWIRMQKRMNFTTMFKEYVSVDDEILPCEVLSVNDICEVTENEEMSETDEE